jgi:hypothetical protein
LVVCNPRKAGLVRIGFILVALVLLAACGGGDKDGVAASSADGIPRPKAEWEESFRNDFFKDLNVDPVIQGEQYTQALVDKLIACEAGLEQLEKLKATVKDLDAQGDRFGQEAIELTVIGTGQDRKSFYMKLYSPAAFVHELLECEVTEN